MPVWLDTSGQDAVRSFWELCGEVEPFPRSLERSLALALPVYTESTLEYTSSCSVSIISVWGQELITTPSMLAIAVWNW